MNKDGQTLERKDAKRAKLLSAHSHSSLRPLRGTTNDRPHSTMRRADDDLSH
jgi:hypothetical protein